MQEFWFTAGATFFYFTAFVSLLSGFVGYEDEEWQYWIDANIAAGVSFLSNTGEREILGILAEERERERDCTNIPISRSFRGPSCFLREGEMREERGTLLSYLRPELPYILSAISSLHSEPRHLNTFYLNHSSLSSHHQYILRVQHIFRLHYLIYLSEGSNIIIYEYITATISLVSTINLLNT